MAKSHTVSMKRILGLLQQRPASLAQFSGYVMTAGAATIVDVVTFSVLTHWGLWYVLALCISYFLGICTNFSLSRRFVFRVYWKSWQVQYLVFTIVALNSLLANLGLLQLFINDFKWDKTVARIISAGCVALLSFVNHKLYSFGSGAAAEATGDRKP